MLGDLVSRPFALSNSAVSDADFTVIGILSCGSAKSGSVSFPKLLLEVQNAEAVRALADFKVEGKVSEDANWCEILSGSDWESASAPIQYKTGNANTVAADSSVLASLDIGPYFQLRFSAKAAAGGTTAVNIFGRMWR